MRRRSAVPEAVAVPLGFAAFYTAFFAPVLFGPRLLAPDDGWTYFLPAFLSPPRAWTDLLFAGFPALADPQAQSFYPLARLFALVPGAWDAYIVSAYVLASSFAYAYARATGGSRLAGVVAGLVYGSSGFLVAHLRHAAFIHTAAWLPLVLTGLERLRAGPAARWVAISALAVALLALGGSPQLLVYGLGLVVAYAVLAALAGPAPARQRAGAPRAFDARTRFALRYLSLAALAVVLGVGLAAVQLLPAAELASLSPRAALSRWDFASYALGPSQLALLVFPYLQGGAFGTDYRGPWNLAELSGYVGLLPLVLAAIGVARGPRRDVAAFWAAVAVVAALLTLGPATPLGELTYGLPGYRLFKALARHFLELSMAVAALAALGVDAVRAGVPQRRLRAVAIGATAAVALLALLVTASGAGAWAQTPSSLALLVPLAVLVLGVTALLVWGAAPRRRSTGVLLAAAVALDLASFGWFFEWRTRAPSAVDLRPPEIAERLRRVLDDSGQRLLAASGHTGERNEIPVNTSRIWGVPSAAGYNPLLQQRLARLVPVANWGAPHGPWAQRANRGLDLLAVRYVTVPASALRPDSLPPAGGEPPPGVVLGSGCGGEEPAEWTFDVPADAPADSLELVTSLLCSTGVPQGAAVLRVVVHGATDSVRVLRAGVDTAEWMGDCPGVREILSHEQPRPLGSWPLPRGAAPPGGPCDWSAYVTRVALPPDAPQRVSLRWTGPYGAIRIHRVALVGDASSMVLDPERSALRDAGRWRRRGRPAPDVVLLENRRAQPRAWLVERAAVLAPDDVLRTIHTSTLPDGTPFDPASVALVEEPVDLPRRVPPAGAQGRAGPVEQPPEVEIVERDQGTMTLRVRAPRPALLVTSDAWYPGWRAWVDGHSSGVVRADYVLRAVRVPSGEHTVRFAFRSAPLRAGLAVSVASALLLVLACSWSWRRARRGRRSGTA